jgi:hypothetical protein
MRKGAQRPGKIEPTAAAKVVQVEKDFQQSLDDHVAAVTDPEDAILIGKCQDGRTSCCWRALRAWNFSRASRNRS